MVSSSFSCILLCLLSLFLLATKTSCARYTNSNSNSNQLRRLSTMSPKQQAEKFIRDLNLFPKQTLNIASDKDVQKSLDSSSSTAPKIYEKEFKLDVLGDPGASLQDFAHHAGFYRIPRTQAARMFYLFFESRSNKTADPVVIWLSGGPGCSSQLALFYENGPFKITTDLSLTWNDYGWDKASNILFIDQPIGTGFSTVTDESDIPHDEDVVSNDLYDFLQEFFKGHPQFVKNDFYITGESYAGHYIPAIASRIYQANKKKQGIQINLKGFAIGNGLTNPAVQYNAYPDYALQKKLIQQSDYDTINQDYVPECNKDVKACDTQGGTACGAASESCESIFRSILSIARGINYYDIRKKCTGSLCYDFSGLEYFLNNQTVKDALGVGDTGFVSCSSDVYEAMSNDMMKNFDVVIPAMLEDGIRALIYAGEEDLICNWIGNSRWVNALKWSGQEDFRAAPQVPFVVDGGKAGELKSHGPLAFLKVYSAGHMVPMDQPKAALQMLQNWMQGKLAVAGTKNEISLQ